MAAISSVLHRQSEHLHYAGELTPIWTPDEEQEAMRDLIRTRKQAMDAVKVAKQQLLGFLLRHGLRYENGSYWTKRHRRWLAELGSEQEQCKIVR